MVKETSCLCPVGNRLGQHCVFSIFWLLSHFHNRLFWTACLKGSGIFDILLAGAFVYIYLISVGKLLVVPCTCYVYSPHPCFPWMVVMKHLVRGFVAHFHLAFVSLVDAQHVLIHLASSTKYRMGSVKVDKHFKNSLKIRSSSGSNLPLTALSMSSRYKY